MNTLFRDIGLLSFQKYQTPVATKGSGVFQHCRLQRDPGLIALLRKIQPSLMHVFDVVHPLQHVQSMKTECQRRIRAHMPSRSLFIGRRDRDAQHFLCRKDLTVGAIIHTLPSHMKQHALR